MLRNLISLMVIVTSFAQNTTTTPFVPAFALRSSLDLPMTASPILGVGVSLMLQHQVPAYPLDQINANTFNRMSINAFDRGATYNYSPVSSKISDGLVVASLLSPLVLLVDKNMRSQSSKIILISTQTLLWNTAFNNLVKTTVKRPRPYLYNFEDPVPLDLKLKKDSRFSFYSGHTSSTAALCFTTATLYNHYYPNSNSKPYVWAGAALVPALTGYLRYRAGKHYPTDIITGYIAGALIGVLIPKLHLIN